jgi:hypothetical protein
MHFHKHYETSKVLLWFKLLLPVAVLISTHDFISNIIVIGMITLCAGVRVETAAAQQG